MAGPITGTSYRECTDWRGEFAEMMDDLRDEGANAVECVSPMRMKEHLAHIDQLSSHGDKTGVSSDRSVFGRDTWDVRRCDILLVNALGMRRASIGTVFEMGVAHALGKLIITVIDEDEWTGPGGGTAATLSENPFDHLFINSASDYIVHSLEAAAELIGAL
jgi:hypothetical protein